MTLILNWEWLEFLGVFWENIGGFTVARVVLLGGKNSILWNAKNGFPERKVTEMQNLFFSRGKPSRKFAIFMVGGPAPTSRGSLRNPHAIHRLRPRISRETPTDSLHASYFYGTRARRINIVPRAFLCRGGGGWALLGGEKLWKRGWRRMNLGGIDKSTLRE